jgi:uncharacterized membrane protein
MEGDYRILYTGELMPGRALDEVVPLFADKFKLQDETARDLIIRGRGRLLKEGLSEAEARRYRDALEEVGVQVSIEPLPVGDGDPGMSGRNERDRAEGPDAPPHAEGADKCLETPRSRPAGQGWLWITEAWQIFKRQPGAWIGALILFYLIIILLGMVPLIGGLTVTILSPMLAAGLMIGARRQDRAGRFELSHLFAGVARYPGQLALLGLLYLLLAIGILMIVGLIFAGVFAFTTTRIDPSVMNPTDIDLFLATPLLVLPLLVAMLLGIPLAMAMFFAPSLVALDHVPVLEAFRLSLVGCLKNILPFLVYGLIAMLMIFIGSLPLLLGLLVVIPVLAISIYTAYRDIYYRPC